MAVHLAAPRGGVGDTVQGLGQGSTELYMPPPTRGPRASCPLGHHGCVQSRPALGSRVQLSQEPRGVVVIDLLARGPACTERCGCVCRMFPRCHSTRFTTACDSGEGGTWEGVHVHETTEMKWLHGTPAVAERTEASCGPGPTACPLRGDEVQASAAPGPALPPQATSLFLLSWHSLPRRRC